MPCMPPKPQKAVMTPGELRTLMEKHGHTQGTFAELLGVHRNTVNRWLNGPTPINALHAALIREKLRTIRKK